MKIATLTVRQTLDLMGSEATDGEAQAMIKILQASPYADTRDVPDEEWRKMMDQAISS